MNLTIDIGNTHVKTAFFKGKAMSKATVHSSFSLSTLKALAGGMEKPEKVILCTVRDYPVEWKNYLQQNFSFIELSEKTPLPVKNDYLAPASLGKDRLACAVGANAIFPGRNVLAITAGTCIIYDFVDGKGVYKGGAISPGLDMRFKSLHTFTGRLPLVEADTTYKNILGRTTEQSIRSGVQQGMLQEIEGIIKTYKSKYAGLKIILSGGSMPWLKQSLSVKINPEPFLALKGLNVILATFPKGNNKQ